MRQFRSAHFAILPCYSVRHLPLIRYSTAKARTLQARQKDLNVSDLENLERELRDKLLNSKDLESQTKAMELIRTLAESRKIDREAEKLGLETKTVESDYRFGKTRFWATTLTPLLAVALTATAIVMQTIQFKKTDKQQQAAREDTAWQEAVGNVSLENSGTILSSARTIQSFLSSGSPQHRKLARSVLLDLLLLTNTNTFDSIVEDLFDQTNQDNQRDIIELGRTLIDLQKEHYRQHAIDSLKHTSRERTRSMLGVTAVADFAIKGKEAITYQNYQYAETMAWKIQGVSDFLSRKWSEKTPSVVPEKDLSGLVLETKFDGVNFSGVDMTNVTLYEASLKRVDLTGTKLNDAVMDDADLSEVTKIEGSQWRGANWWEAKCLSPTLLKYLRQPSFMPDPEKTEEWGKATSFVCRSH